MREPVALLGLLAFVGVAWTLSTNRKVVDWVFVAKAFALQWFFALSVLGLPQFGLKGPLRPVFQIANHLILQVLEFTSEGAEFLFGPLIETEKFGFVFAFQVLPVIIFMGSLMAVFYHWGVMQRVVQTLSWCMQRIIGASGTESLAAAANIFLGQTEAPLVIRPYLSRLTRSELMTVMTGGMATVAGSVLAAYVGLLKDRLPEIGGHLLTASVMSAPARWPEVGSQRGGHVVGLYCLGRFDEWSAGRIGRVDKL